MESRDPAPASSQPSDRQDVRPSHRDPGFSPILTGLAVAILLGGAVLFAWMEVTVSPLERMATPGRALALMVGREMEIEEALAVAPLWERWLYELSIGDGTDETDLAIVWYEELAAYSGQARDELALAVLEAESGRLERVRQKISSWPSRPEPFPAVARLLSAGYLNAPLDGPTEQSLQADLAELMPGGWFYDRLSLALATRVGDKARLDEAAKRKEDRDEKLLGRTRSLVVVEAGSLLLGLVAAAVVLRRSRTPHGLQVGTAPLPPSWSGKSGAIVLVQGGALGILCMFAWLSFETEDLLARLLSIPAANAPLLVLAHRYLFSRTEGGFVEVCGLKPSPNGWLNLAVILPAILAVGFLGEGGLGRLAGALGLASHWTEWFDGDLAWGGAPLILVSLTEYVVFAPVFEEVVFRGLLFATLRRKFGWGLSATLSSAVFAVAHGYGALGFASVLLSGVLWAWTYEKTGSLLPGILAHAANNLLVCLTVMWLLR